jgi:glycosyltransferase involved in cell wall biosynthesis
VSVIVPAYRAGPGPAWLDEALDSVRAQTFRAFEIIVVDDGSPLPIAPRRTEDLTLFVQGNSGPGGARNLGAAHARGEFVAYLDSDDAWLPGKLEAQVELHDRDPALVLSCTDVIVFDDSGAEQPQTTSSQMVETGHRIPYARLFMENCLGCSTVMVRADALARTPGMVPNRRWGEDYGLWLRLGLLGPIGCVPLLLARHRRHPGSLSVANAASGSRMHDELNIYGELLAEHPELEHEPFVDLALGHVRLDGGLELLSRGDFVGARRELLRSLGHRRLQPLAWLHLARALLHLGAGHP